MPYHLLARGKTVDELPLETFCGSAVTYDLTHKALGSRVSPDDLKKAIPLKNGEIALFYTGSNVPATSGSTSRPYTSLDITMADWLIEKQAKAVGIDSMSVDLLHSPENEVHKKLLQNGIVIFENLSDNLRLLMGQRVLFFGAPLRLKRADASPIRAFALILARPRQFIAKLANVADARAISINTNATELRIREEKQNERCNCLRYEESCD